MAISKEFPDEFTGQMAGIDPGECQFTSEFGPYEQVLWLLSIVAVQLAYFQRGRIPLATEREQSANIHLSIPKQMLELVQRLIAGDRIKIGQYKQKGIFLSYDVDEKKLVLTFRHSPLYADDYLQPNIHLIHANAKPIMELGLKGLVAEAIVNENTSAVTYFFKNGTVWVIDHGDPHYDVHLALATGSEVVLGEELSAPAFYKAGNGYFAEATGIPIAREAPMIIDKVAAVAIKVAERKPRCKRTEDTEGYGILSLDFGSNEHVTVRETDDYHYFMLLFDLLRNKSIQAGYAAGGHKAFFSLKSGIIMRNDERNYQRLPLTLDAYTRLANFVPGTFWQVEPGETVFTCFRGNKDIVVDQSHPDYAAMKKLLVEHQVGILCEPEAGLCNGNPCCKVYLFAHTEAGMVVKIHSGHLEDNKVYIHELDNFYDHTPEFFILNFAVQRQLTGKYVYVDSNEESSHLKKQAKKEKAKLTRKSKDKPPHKPWHKNKHASNRPAH